MSEKSKGLLDALVNASFDCGHWRERKDFIPSDDTPVWKPYYDALERKRQARAEIEKYIEGLETDLDERKYQMQTMGDIALENDRVQSLKIAALTKERDELREKLAMAASKNNP